MPICREKVTKTAEEMVKVKYKGLTKAEKVHDNSKFLCKNCQNMVCIHQNFHQRGEKILKSGQKSRFSCLLFHALAYLFLYFQVRVTSSVGNGKL